jgi:hypothetical protein
MTAGYFVVTMIAVWSVVFGDWQAAADKVRAINIDHSSNSLSAGDGGGHDGGKGASGAAAASGWYADGNLTTTRDEVDPLLGGHGCTTSRSTAVSEGGVTLLVNRCPQPPA